MSDRIGTIRNKKTTSTLRPFLTGGKSKYAAAAPAKGSAAFQQRARAASTGRLGSSRVKKSEYARQYQPYDLEQQNAHRPQQYKPRQSIGGPLGTGDAHVHWKSVQQEDYLDADVDRFAQYSDTAGVPTESTGNMRSTLNTDAGWQQMDAQAEKENRINEAADPRRSIGGPSWRNASAQKAGKLTTEQSRQYYWKQGTERAHSAKPTGLTAPILQDSFGPDEDDRFASDYQQKTQQLRAQQAAIQQLQRPAGKSSLQQLPNPTFYAYAGAEDNNSDDELRPRPRLQLQPAVGFNRGTTEHKHKFPEWPLQEKVAIVRPRGELSDGNWQQQADPTGRYAAPTSHRHSSQIKDDYPAHDAMFVRQQQQEASNAAAASRNSSNMNPPVFAWNLQNPEAAPDGYYDAEDEKAKKNRSKDLTWFNQASEYTHQYGALAGKNRPEHEFDRASKVPGRADTLNIFDTQQQQQQQGNGGVLSEYVDQFSNADTGAVFSNTAAAAARMKQRQQGDHPAQFAWSGAAAWAADEQPPLQQRQRQRGRVAGAGEQSEYNSKYPWPPMSQQQRQPPAAAPKGSDDVLGIDADDAGESATAAWRSEYQDVSFNAPSAAATAPIAGVPSAPNPMIPTHFAWPMPPPPPLPVSPPVSSRLPGEAQVRSEQREKFVRWPLAEKSEHVARRTNDESAADTFELRFDSSSGNDSDRLNATGANVLSEYSDQYTGRTAASASDGSSSDGSPAEKRRRDDAAVPKQFAWPRIDPITAPSAAADNSSLLLQRPHIPFTATSEYESNFTPLPLQQAYQRVRNPYTATSNVIVPLPERNSNNTDDGDYVAATSADIDAAAKAAAAVDLPAAGVRSFPDGTGAPNFYVWSALPSAAGDDGSHLPVVEVPFYHSTEPLSSEYADSYSKSAAAAAAETTRSATTPALLQPRRNSFDLISGLDREDPREHYPQAMSSEYDDQFHSFTARQLQQQQQQQQFQFDPLGVTCPPGSSFRYPPQFAWSLLDQKSAAAETVALVAADAKEKTPTGTSEYRSKFIAQPMSAADAAAAAEEKQKPPKRSFSLSAAAAAGTDNSPSNWKSEYDDSCDKLKERQLQMRAAGLKSGVLKTTSAAFGGKNSSAAVMSATAPAASKFDPPATTEYREQFIRLPLDNQPKTRFSETYRHLGFLPQNHFDGISEYDDKYQPKLLSNTTTTTSNAGTATVKELMDRNYPNPSEYQRKYSWIDSVPKEVAGGADMPKPRFRGAAAATTTAATTAAKEANMGKTAVPRFGGATAAFAGRELRRQVGTFGTSRRHLQQQQNTSPEPTPRFKYAQHNNRPNTAPSTSTGGGGGDDRSAGDNSNYHDDFGAAAESSGNFGSTASTVDRVGRHSEAAWHPSMQRSLRPNTAAATTDANDATNASSGGGGGGYSDDFSQSAAPSTPQQSNRSQQQQQMMMQSTSPPAFGRKTSLFADFAGGDRKEQKNRSKSTPPRTFLSQTQQPKAYVEEKMYNPVLLNKRYPYVSMKQLGRWTSESHDKFRWSKKPYSASTAMHSP